MGHSNLSGPAFPARAELCRPGERPQPEPERREEPVEDDERSAENAVPEGPAPGRDGWLGLHPAAALRRSTSWMIRCEISSIDSSLTSSTGQPRRRWTCSAYSSSS